MEMCLVTGPLKRKLATTSRGGYHPVVVGVQPVFSTRTFAMVGTERRRGELTPLGSDLPEFRFTLLHPNSGDRPGHRSPHLVPVRRGCRSGRVLINTPNVYIVIVVRLVSPSPAPSLILARAAIFGCVTTARPMLQCSTWTLLARCRIERGGRPQPARTSAGLVEVQAAGAATDDDGDELTVLAGMAGEPAPLPWASR